MSNYIVEAFKAMNLLESEDINLNAEGYDTLQGFMDEAGVDPDDEIVDIFDLEAQAEDELKDSYMGKVVLECSVCHSHIFVDKSEVSVGTDEEGLACYDIECPYCQSNEGYTIIGEIAPYNEEESEALMNPEDEDELALPEVDVEGAADDIDTEDLEEPTEAEEEEELEESLKCDGKEELYKNSEIRGVDELKGDVKLEGDDDIRGPLHKTHVNEGIESASIETEDQTINLSTGDDGSVSLEANPKNDLEEEPMMGDTFGMDNLSDEEMIAPLTDDSTEEIEAAADANSVEEGEEDVEFSDLNDESAEDEDFMDFEDFDEDSFNGLGESYLRSCYENVTGFKTTGVSTNNNQLMIEGIIKFDSGNIKETQFVFEAVDKNKFEGYNKQISRGKKTYKLNTSINNKKLVCESLNYNYKSRNELNESVRVYGTVKGKK